mgnify:CR=1 FL=1
MRDDIRDTAGSLRVGMVTDVDNVNHLCRVKYLDRGYTSNWLRVLDNHCFIPGYDQPQRTEYAAGGGGYAEYANHAHGLNIVQWMPVIGQNVLCAYLPAKNSDGFVLGGV